MAEHVTQPDDFKTPGEAIQAALADRGWTQEDLAIVLKRPRPTINEIILGKRAVTPEMAWILAEALGQDAQYWMHLEVKYRLSLVTPEKTVSGVQRRSRAFAIAPVKDMEKRGWISSTRDAYELERELCRFFEVDNLDDEPQISVATRRSTSCELLTPSQRAWCFRARRLAMSVHAEKFKPELLAHCKERLRELAAFPDQTRQVPTVLSGYGIRFVIIEPLPGSRMDGAAFWLAPDQPVIALSVRFDRIDAFWFTLGHEFAHIVNGHASIDSELVGESALMSGAKPEIERIADEESSNMLVPSDKLESFILRVGPLYSRTRINQFAHRMKVHPGIIVGQLQHRGEVSWRAHRESLAPVRSIVTSTALTDGWGYSTSPDHI